MKTARIRIVLLVLLAIVLPLRSAWAVAAHCGPQEGAQVVHVPLGHEDAARHHDAGCSAHALHEGTGGDRHGADDIFPGKSADASGFCGMNAVSCSSVALVNAAAGTVLPPPGTAVDFPSYRVHVASFFGDGPERPPRFA